jgi:hypothetical protein
MARGVRTGKLRRPPELAPVILFFVLMAACKC